MRTLATIIMPENIITIIVSFVFPKIVTFKAISGYIINSIVYINNINVYTITSLNSITAVPLSITSSKLFKNKICKKWKTMQNFFWKKLQ